MDNPHANKIMVRIMAAFVEFEREQIRERTKAGLERAKARGVELGKHGKVIARQNQQAAQTRATARGATWHIPSTYALLKRSGDSD